MDAQPDPAEAIRLDDFLKFCGVVGTGGQAKVLIQAGEVQVNGEVETRRRKQLDRGDVVELLGERFVVGEQ
ncbi:RNA-binding S4 domain-containing protein [Candidatus Laterigemmans baculatus]|uniref:RNA-binding S4 domain-containing protein n=1 Tax=Candidatus Laterigemmans baculatus TaxID=2770505 RepID=UPI0013D98473|nr:RNA-binding S4 domain-containing protein [Candidatus Laterigemmans baculatus]